MTVLDEAAYPDHYAYSRDDVGMLRKRAADLRADIILTTEKDAAKIRPYLTVDDTGWWAVRLRVEWQTGESTIRSMILNARAETGGGLGV